MQHIPDYQQFKKNITEGKVNEGKGQDLADKYVAKLRSEFKKLNDDELDEFKKTIAKSLDLKESVNEGKNAQETIIDGLKLSFQTFFEAGVESDYKMFEKFWKRDYKDLVNAAAKIKVSMRESVNEAQFKHINKSEHKIKLAIKDVEKKSRLKVNRDKEPEYEQLALNKIMLSKVLGRERLGKEHVAAWEKLKKEYELTESVNERFKHNDMYAMLDIAAQYSSTQHQAANQMWSDEQDLYDYLKSDHIPKKYHKDFYNDVKRRFKGVNESVNEGQNNPVDKKFIRDWEKLCLAMIGRLKIDMRKAPVESKSLFTKNIKRIEDVLDVPTEISYFTEGNGLVKEGLSKSAIKKQIKIVSKMIEDEEGGDGEPLTNETLQDLGRELIRLKSLIESYRMS
jgi:hypothetical protein